MIKAGIGEGLTDICLEDFLNRQAGIVEYLF